MGDLVSGFNAVEAGVWWLLAAVCAVGAARGQGRRRRRLGVLAVALTVFGASDIIEMHTGAWWRPWWLLAIKGACLGVVAWVVVGWRRDAGTPDG